VRRKDVAEVTLDTKLGRLELRPEGLLSSPHFWAQLSLPFSPRMARTQPHLATKCESSMRGLPVVMGRVGEEHAFEVSLARFKGEFPTVS
jgi:hypothetical protein